MKKQALTLLMTLAAIAAVGQDFTIVTLPDIQNMTWYPVNQNLYDEMQYIIDKDQELNTQFVVSLGDLTADGYTAISPHSQWEIAKESSDMLVNAGIPYAVCTGNHDMDYVPAYTSPLPFTRFNQYYPVSDFENQPNFGGYFRDMSNAYYLFSASGMDFIIVVLQNYQESSYDPAVAQWANQVLNDHADRRAIVSTHMLNAGNEYMTNIIEKHDNIIMAVYGHHCADDGERYWTTQSPSGNTIHCMMSDYQCRSNEGGGAVIRYYTFRPSENRVDAYTYSTYRDQFETDASSQFSFDYLMVLPEEPGISQTTNHPMYPNSDQTTEITARITDNVSISQAVLHWGLNSNELSNQVTMEGQNDAYAAVIEALPDQQEVFYQISATDGDGHTTISDIHSYLVENDVSKLPCPYNTLQQGYEGHAPPLPGIVDAENYDEGCHEVAYKDVDSDNNGGEYRGESVDIEPTTDHGGGYNVGWTEPGEFLTYTVDVQGSGLYDFHFRVASQTAEDGALVLKVNEVDQSGTVTIPSTGGWQNWTTVTVKDIPLEQGIQVLKIEIEQGDFNLNYFEAEYAGIITSDLSRAKKEPAYIFYLAERKSVRIQTDQTASVRILDLAGRTVLQEDSLDHLSEIQLAHLPMAVYTVQIITQQATISKKIVVR